MLSLVFPLILSISLGYLFFFPSTNSTCMSMLRIFHDSFKNILNKVVESIHPCLNLIVVLNHSPIEPELSTGLVSVSYTFFYGSQK